MRSEYTKKELIYVCSYFALELNMNMIVMSYGMAAVKSDFLTR
jgi:hypothetical protein